MIGWYNTVFLDRRSSHGEEPVIHVAKGKPMYKKLTSSVATLLGSYTEARNARLKHKNSFRELSKLSRAQLEDVGLVPADLLNLKWDASSDSVVPVKPVLQRQVQVQQQRCEVCYLPNLTVQNPNADCGIADANCELSKAA